MAKESFYFKHDLNARADEKIIELLRSHGWTGYGLYWAIVEKLYEAGGRLSAKYETLAFDLRTEAALIEKIVISFDLFYLDADGKIGCKSVDRRLDERRAVSASAREFVSRRTRKDGLPFGSSIGTYNRPNTDLIQGEEKRGEDITDAPSAADLSDQIKKAGDRGANSLLLAKMEDARLPFNFGDFKKGGRIMDLPAEVCAMILDKAPRLGLDLRIMLQERLKDRSQDSNVRRINK